jgi:hypothetical protein
MGLPGAVLIVHRLIRIAALALAVNRTKG